MSAFWKIVGIAVVGLGLLVGGPASATDSVTYSYDSFGRLLTVTFANGTTITYSYDLAGNRTGQQVTCGSNGC